MTNTSLSVNNHKINITSVYILFIEINKSKDIQMNNQKTIDKRIESTKEYIDVLSEQYSKLNVIRIDLSYKKPHSDTMTLDAANSDFDRMMSNRRGKPTIFKDQVGYTCKKEYTKDRGVHFHAIFFYDGQKVLKDILKAEQIGQYWVNEITKEKGSYHNCNRKEYKNKGVGILDHKDSKKRENLDIAVSYLCKDDDQDIEPIKTNEKDRAFVRGTIPKSKKKLGRPRS